ncbi:MAG: hypothetical protein OXI87_07645 [Albidovulum sp.]|nr:hypothetical protein [Albidovulum sp.]MDE0530482.1 hypothetical protein [Albidovulum sp.]
MLHTPFPRDHRRYLQSACAREFEDFAAWLEAGGYSRENIRGHLKRLGAALERSGEEGAGANVSDDRLAELFRCPQASPGRAAGDRATRRAYRRFPPSRGRLDADPS